MSDSNSSDSTDKSSSSKENLLSNSVGVDVKKIKPSIDSLDSYLINALKNPTKKLDTKDSLISKLAKRPKLSEESIKELISLEKNINFFYSFRNLLGFSDLIIGFPVLKDSLMGYLKESLCRNEVIIKLDLEGSILNIENSLPLDLCFKKIKLLSSADLTDEYFKKLKPKEWKNYIATLMLVLAEWYAKTRGMTPFHLIDLLNSSVWSSSIKNKDPDILVKNLLESTNFELIASAVNFYQQKSVDTTSQLLRTASQLDSIAAANLELKNLLNDKDAHISKLQSDLDQLNLIHIDTIATKELQNQTLSITLKNQLEDLRVRNLHLLQASVELLADGLTAISRAEPKINVMKDHAQRVLDSLKSELDHLKGLGK